MPGRDPTDPCQEVRRIRAYPDPEVAEVDPMGWLALYVVAKVLAVALAVSLADD